MTTVLGRGASLPSSPADGDEFALVVDGTNGVDWLCKYNSGSSRWEFLGGPPLRSIVDAQESSSASAYVDLATVGPSITVPYAGEYDILFGTSIILPGTSNNGGAMSARVASGADDYIAYFYLLSGNSAYATVSRTKRATAAASDSIVAKYYSNNSQTISFFERFLEVRPVTLS